MLQELLITILKYAPVNRETIETPHKSRIEVLASGLDSPQKLSFTDGILHVAEAERGKSETSHTTFSPDPLYDQVKHYTTTIAADGDPADVYYPVVPSTANQKADQLPIVLMLQGALVDKADYSNYAQTVARYGFCLLYTSPSPRD